jgi:hypothetical protein
MLFLQAMSTLIALGQLSISGSSTLKPRNTIRFTSRRERPVKAAIIARCGRPDVFFRARLAPALTNDAFAI